ncbi:endonuclease [Spongiactinospora rosea]|uniref:Endonuclease n=1 Tax=Spongiactinospora rosea TaxID=2248750 RepID=A0A366LYR9_9ACTN|nr:endonuclease [Spongiactinospora rosea]RBQ18464.1 endonuclease [Spongiactinospora rosea]
MSDVATVLKTAGQTYAEQAGIKLRDQPRPLWQLLVLANLLSARINSDVAVAAARELFAAGGDTPKGMARLSWQDRVDALGRGHYVRYDESTSSRLGECAELILGEYGGDMRKVAEEAGRDPKRLRQALQRFKGIGETGADIFCREAQEVWPWLRPYFDKRALSGAGRVHLPRDPGKLARLTKPDDLAHLAAALVRISRDTKLAHKADT